MSKVTVRLHGVLDVLDSPTITLQVDTANEAAKAIMQHIKRVASKDITLSDISFQIRGFDTDESLSAALQDEQVLDFMPALGVGKKGGFFQLVVGAVLIVAGVLLASSFVLGGLSTYLVTTGAAMVIGGVVQLLMPAPRLDTQPEDTNPEASKYISGTGNTTKAGTRIPLGYGTFIHYGHIVSININSKELASGAATGYGYGNTTGLDDPDIINYSFTRDNYDF